MRLLMRDLLRGAIAGAAATLPMSAVTLTGQKLGAMPKQPPEEIVDSALDAADADVTEQASNVLATLNHVAFGATVGVAYAALRRLTGNRGNGVATGMAYGLAVWFANYQGWVPRMTPLPPTTEDRDDRQTVMAAAHAVYGAVLGAITDRD